MKKQIRYGAIQKVCHLRNGTFHSIQLCHILLVTLSLPLCYLLNFTKKSQNERKDFFAFMAASSHHAISKEIENHIFRHK